MNLAMGMAGYSLKLGPVGVAPVAEERDEDGDESDDEGSAGSVDSDWNEGVVQPAGVSVNAAVDCVRRAVIAIRCSSLRTEAYRRACRGNNLKELKLIRDVPTRWNSKVDMLKRAYEQRAALTDVCTFDRKLNHLLISEAGWETLLRLVRLLNGFKQATLAMSHLATPTLSAVIPVFNGLIDRLEKVIGDPASGPDVTKAAQAALDKMLEYYSKTDNDSDAYMISMLCNPQFNVPYMVDKSWEAELISDYRDLFLRTLKQYDLEPALTNGDGQTLEEDDEFGEQVYIQPAMRGGAGRTLEQEAAAYHGEPRVGQDDDILKWWFGKRGTYPRIYRMAMDYLAIQGTSTAAERDFSSAGRIHTTKRASMKAKTLERVFLLKSWYAFQKRRLRRGKERAKILIDHFDD